MSLYKFCCCLYKFAFVLLQVCALDASFLSFGLPQAKEDCTQSALVVLRLIAGGGRGIGSVKTIPKRSLSPRTTMIMASDVVGVYACNREGAIFLWSNKN